MIHAGINKRTEGGVPRTALWALLPILFFVAGCGSDNPFDLLPVEGKVTYEDGSLIPAQSMLVTFTPIEAKREGKMVAPSGQTQVNVADGTFAGVTSRRKNDGLVKGKYQVVVVSFAEGPDGLATPNNAVPPRYRKLATTPLQIDVDSKNQFIEIKVSKQ